MRNKSLQLPLLIGVVMHLSQQLSGINAVSIDAGVISMRPVIRRINPGYSTLFTYR